MLKTLVLALTLVVTLTGCAATYLLPNAEGRCYQVTTADLDVLGGGMMRTAEAIDGWRCRNLEAGDIARTEETRGYVKPSTCPERYAWNGNGCSEVVAR